MELKNIINKLSNKHKGTFVSVAWTSNIESAAARKHGNTVVKETVATVRWGIQYENIKKVKAQRALEALTEKTRKEYKPWYKHLEQAPYILQHLSDPGKTYLQLFTINKKNSTKTIYYVNGEKKSKQYVIDSGLVNPSEWAQKGECLIMNIPTDKIRLINNKGANG